jgi:DNA-binding SARP family transcriptional activator/DNA-binding XRE family transcriptional regulator
MNGSRWGNPVGALVRSHRQAANFSQAELAAKAGISVAALRDLEQGRRRRPRQQTVARLCRALSLDNAQARELARAGRPTRQGRSGSTEPAAAQGEIQIQILGTIAAWRDGQSVRLGPPRQRAVLGLLALTPGSWWPRENLIDAVWGDGAPSAVVNLVQVYVSRIRRAIDPGRPARDEGNVLTSGPSGYRLQITSEQLDLSVFRELTEQARIKSEDPEAACEYYARALRLWRGDPLADITVLRNHPGVQALRREYVAAVLGYADACAMLGRPELAVESLWAVIAKDPLHEPACARLMTALAGAGEQASALRVYEDIRLRLDDQLGIRPSPALVEAHVQVLRQAVPLQRI